jgi:hypothetical protein
VYSLINDVVRAEAETGIPVPAELETKLNKAVGEGNVEVARWRADAVIAYLRKVRAECVRAV